MAFELTLRHAWEIVHQDMKHIYQIATPIFSRPCLAILNVLGSAFIFGQVIILTVLMLCTVKLIVGKMGYPVRQTMHRIYLFMGLCAVAQICLSSFILIISLQSVLVLLFVASVGAYILD